jgi:gamma-glutamylcysteine synthetase
MDKYFGTNSVRGKNATVIFFVTVIEPKNESLYDSTKLSLAKKTTKKWACLWQKALLCPLFGRFFS